MSQDRIRAMNAERQKQERNQQIRTFRVRSLGIINSDPPDPASLTKRRPFRGDTELQAIWQAEEVTDDQRHLKDVSLSSESEGDSDWEDISSGDKEEW